MPHRAALQQLVYFGRIDQVFAAAVRREDDTAGADDAVLQRFGIPLCRGGVVPAQGAAAGVQREGKRLSAAEAVSRGAASHNYVVSVEKLITAQLHCMAV